MISQPLFNKGEKPEYIPRVAAVHDLCGYGKCSLGVAIPVISAGGCDVCPIPTGLFSSHTQFPFYHMHDTTPMLEAYLDAWAAVNVEIDAVYSGFLGAPSWPGRPPYAGGGIWPFLPKPGGCACTGPPGPPPFLSVAQYQRPCFSKHVPFRPQSLQVPAALAANAATHSATATICVFMSVFPF